MWTKVIFGYSIYCGNLIVTKKGLSIEGQLVAGNVNI